MIKLFNCYKRFLYEKSFFAKYYKILNINFTINIKNLIITLILNNEIYIYFYISLLEQNTLRKNQVYKIDKKAINNIITIIYIGLTNFTLFIIKAIKLLKPSLY